MERLLDWRAIVLAFALAVGATAGIAAGAQLLSEPASAALKTLVPSSAPALLGPITETGRTGWDCLPERTARATSARAAELPTSVP